MSKGTKSLDSPDLLPSKLLVGELKTEKTKLIKEINIGLLKILGVKIGVRKVMLRFLWDRN